jgi:phage FluMu protein Com
MTVRCPSCGRFLAECEGTVRVVCRCGVQITIERKTKSPA